MELNFGQEMWYSDAQIRTALDIRANYIKSTHLPNQLPKPFPIELDFASFLDKHFSNLIGKSLTVIPTNKYSSKVTGILEKIEQKNVSGYVLSFVPKNTEKTPQNQLLAIDDFVGKVSVILDWDQWVIQKNIHKNSIQSVES